MTDRRERTHFCRECKHERTGTAMPRGWYTLSRSLGPGDFRAGGASFLRLGIFCSLKCLLARLPEFQRTEDDLGGRWRRLVGADHKEG